MYKAIIRPCLFCIDAEKIHNQLVSIFHLYRHMVPVRGIVRSVYRAKDVTPFSWQHLTFANRIGLSAGFDKEASCFDELSDFGFGFIEVGTITPASVSGNPSPRVFRLPKDRALISRTGFNNPGKAIVLQNLKHKKEGKYILGININTNHPADEVLAVAELTDLYVSFGKYADYYTLNWGSISPEILGSALAAFAKEKIQKPVFLKLPADVPLDKINDIIEFARKHHIGGFIATGPTQDRSLLVHSTQQEITEVGAGGISGTPVLQKSREVVKYLAAHAPKEMLIIGAGAVTTAEEATSMLQAGAHLVQIYSAFIYEGPGIVKQMVKACK